MQFSRLPNNNIVLCQCLSKRHGQLLNHDHHKLPQLNRPRRVYRPDYFQTKWVPGRSGEHGCTTHEKLARTCIILLQPKACQPPDRPNPKIPLTHSTFTRLGIHDILIDIYSPSDVSVPIPAHRVRSHGKSTRQRKTCTRHPQQATQQPLLSLNTAHRARNLNITGNNGVQLQLVAADGRHVARTRYAHDCSQ
jgi:hypothetical protein